MMLPIITKNHINLREFPSSVQDVVNEWLFDLPSDSSTIWNDLTKLFLEKDFLEAKVSNLCREILRIKQGKRVALHTLGSISRSY